MTLPWQPNIAESRCYQVVHPVALDGSDEIVVRSVLLEHQPHGLHEVSASPQSRRDSRLPSFQVLGEAEHLMRATPSLTLRLTTPSACTYPANRFPRPQEGV